jgi:hypothetical protein
VGLGGQGIAPVVTLSPSSVAFPAQRVGDASASSVTLSNTGDAPLYLTSIATQGSGFTETNGCAATLPAGASCTIQVQFSPSSSGTAAGAIAIQHDAPGGPSTVALSGEAVDFSLALYPGSYPVAQGQAASFGLVLTRSGNTGFTWPVALVCSGAPAGTTCTFSPASPVTPGWQTQVTVRVGPAVAAARLPRGGAALAFLVLPAVVLAGSRRRGAPWAILLALAVAAGSVACGGGSAPSLSGGGGASPGTYAITVTATSGALTHAATAQLVVN